MNGFFNTETIENLDRTLHEGCGDGVCISNDNLTIKAGYAKEDAPLVSACVKRHLSDKYAIKLGPEGGWHRKDIPLKERPKPVKEETPPPEGLVEAVKALLESKPTGLAVGFIQGKLDERFPKVDASMITSIIRGFGTHVSKPGLGWIPKGADNTSSN